MPLCVRAGALVDPHERLLQTLGTAAPQVSELKPDTERPAISIISLVPSVTSTT